MLKIGHASCGITPEPGLTLSGFAARCNRPSDGVADPLAVHALSAEAGGERVLLLVFDLLALGPESLERIHAALDAAPGVDAPRSRRLLCCTHTHSAPAAITLLGCGILEPAYRDRLAGWAAAAAAVACRQRRPATLRFTRVTVPGHNYNRRQILESGQVRMVRHSAPGAARTGPTWDTLLLARFDDEAGRGIAGLAHWACHPCTVMTSKVSADFPGALRRGLSERFGLPFLFLQGACANLNPPFETFAHDEMRRNAAALLADVREVKWPAPAPSDPFALTSCSVPLRYAARPPAAELERYARGMEEIALTSQGPADAMATLANTLNVEPGKWPDPAMARHTAATLGAWARRTLALPDAAAKSCDLALSVWRLGPLAWCFVAAEVFVETALALRATRPGLELDVVGYASPLVGYLPPDAALAQGGYEPAMAYRFYGHPAAFAPGSEPAVRRVLEGLLSHSICRLAPSTPGHQQGPMK